MKGERDGSTPEGWTAAGGTLPEPGVQPTRTAALVNCPDCGRPISRLAPTCPGCGRPTGKQAVTIEQTSKRWKAIMVIGGIIAIGGAVTTAVAWNHMISKGGYAATWIGVLICIAGLAITAIGQVCAWWYHG